MTNGALRMARCPVFINLMWVKLIGDKCGKDNGVCGTYNISEAGKWLYGIEFSK